MEIKVTAPPKEPAEDKPPKAAPKSSAKSSDKPRGSAGTNLEKELRGLFEIVAGTLMFADPAAGLWTEMKAPELARAWAMWAQKNAAVRRALETLATGGAAGNAIGVSSIWALGCYLIYLSRRQELPPAWAAAGGLFGVPIPDPSEAPTVENVRANGAAAEPGPYAAPPAGGWKPGDGPVAGGRVDLS